MNKRNNFSFVFTFLFVMLSITLINAQSVSEWTNFNRQVNGDTFYAGNFNLTGIELLWNYTFPSSFEINPISVYEGKVYVGAYGDFSLTVLNSSNGNLLWNYSITSNLVNLPVINKEDGLVYIVGESSSGDGFARLYALNKDTGIEVWTYDFDARNDLSNPVIVGDILYFKVQNGYSFFALNKTSGEQLWNKTYYKNNWGTPTYSNGKLFLNFEDDGLILAINSSNGDEIWNYSALVTWYGTPLVKNGVLYTGTYDNSIIALDEDNGSLIWTFPTGSDCEGTPAEYNGILTWGCYDTFFYALNSSDGTQLWNFSAGIGINYESSPVITQNGIVFFATYQGSPDTLYALDLYNGNVLWSYNTTTQMDYVTPTIVDNVIYFSDYNGIVYAVGKLQVLEEEVVVPQRTDEGQAIYDVFNSSGAGLGLFLKYVGYGLMILIPALIVVGIVLVLLKPIKKIFGTA